MCTGHNSIKLGGRNLPLATDGVIRTWPLLPCVVVAEGHLYVRRVFCKHCLAIAAVCDDDGYRAPDARSRPAHYCLLLCAACFELCIMELVTYSFLPLDATAIRTFCKTAAGPGIYRTKNQIVAVANNQFRLIIPHDRCCTRNMCN